MRLRNCVKHRITVMHIIAREFTRCHDASELILITMLTMLAEILIAIGKSSWGYSIYSFSVRRRLVRWS